MNFAGFVVVGGLAAALSYLMLFQKTLYSSALCLLGVLLQVSALYFLLGAQVLALIQVLVYAGAVMVLIVVAVMASPPRLKELWTGGKISRSLAVATLVFPSFLAGVLCVRAAAPSGAWALAAAPSLERGMAQLLFGPYALMTETAGLIMLVSVLALVLAES